MSCADELQRHVSSSECEIITCVGKILLAPDDIRVEFISFIVKGRP